MSERLRTIGDLPRVLDIPDILDIPDFPDIPSFRAQKGGTLSGLVYTQGCREPGIPTGGGSLVHLQG